MMTQPPETPPDSYHAPHFPPESDLYRQLFERTRTIKLVIDPTTLQIVDANPVACEFYGYTYQQMTGLLLSDVNARPLAEVKSIVQNVRSGATPIFETQHRTAAGEIHDVEVAAGSLDIEGKPYIYALVLDITERKKTEKALRESEALYRSFAQNMPNSSVIMFDTDMRYTLAEGPFLKTFGDLYKDFVGKTPIEALPKHLANFIVPMYQRALRGESFHFERVTETYSYVSYATPVRNEAGTIIGGMILSHDITEKQRAAEALRASEQRYQSVITTMSEAIILVASDATIQSCNPAAEQILGIPAADMIGLSVGDVRWNLLDEQGLPLSGDPPATITLKSGQAFTSVVLSVQKPDGKRVWISLNTRPVRPAPDTPPPYAVVTSFTDITRRKLVEDALAANEQRLRLITDNIQDILTYSDSNDQILYANPTAHTILGFEPDQIVGKSRKDFVHPNDWAPMTAVRQKAIDASAPMFKVEGRVSRIDGSYVDVETVGALIYDEFVRHQGGVYITRDITERKRLENELRTSEQRLRFITDHMTDLVMQRDTHNRTLYVSPSIRTVLGYEPDEFVALDAPSLVHPDDMRIVQASMEQVYRGEPVRQMIIRMRHAKGHYIIAEITGNIIFDEAGIFIGGIYVTRDITERKRLEDALRTSNTMLTQVIENIPFRVFWKDHNSVYQGCNTLHARGNGLSTPADIIGKTDQDFLPERAAEWETDDRSIMTSGVPKLNVEELVTDSDGTTRWLRSNKVPLHSDDGSVKGILVTIEDITAPKRLEEALRLNEARLRSITDNVADLIILTDENRQIMFASPSLQSILGYTPETLINTRLARLIHPDDADRVQETAIAARTTGRTSFEVSYRLHHANGQYIEVETSVRYIFDTDKQLRGTVLVIRDVSHRDYLTKLEIQQEKLKTALEKEKELSDLKTRMMERITHEFRTPLAIIQSSADTLTSYYERLTPEKRAAKVQTLVGQIRHITDMLDEIGLVVGGTFRPDYVKHTTIDLSAMCRDVADKLARSYNLPDKFVLALPEQAFIHADPDVLSNVFLHLLRNTIGYSKPAAPVQVSLRQLANQYELRITDHGIGILPDELPRIFDPFFRGTNINEVGGLGIGLPIVRAAIEAHGGSIEVESTVNVGTTFIVKLPIA